MVDLVGGQGEDNTLVEIDHVGVNFWLAYFHVIVADVGNELSDGDAIKTLSWVFKGSIVYTFNCFDNHGLCDCADDYVGLPCHAHCEIDCLCCFEEASWCIHLRGELDCKFFFLKSLCLMYHQC